MLNFLYKNKPVDTVKIPTRPKVGLFHVVFTRSTQPSPGAEDMAYRTLALPPLSPIGPATTNSTVINATARPVVAVQTETPTGLPTQAGNVRMQPLFDPQSGGYNAGFMGIDNVPYRQHEIAPVGVSF